MFRARHYNEPMQKLETGVGGGPLLELLLNVHTKKNINMHRNCYEKTKQEENKKFIILREQNYYYFLCRGFSTRKRVTAKQQTPSHCPETDLQQHIRT